MRRRIEDDDQPWPAVGCTAVRADSALAVALFLASALSMELTRMALIYGTRPASPLLSLALLACVALPLAIRRWAPSVCGVCVAAGAAVAWLLTVPEMLVLNISMFLALYSVGAWEQNRLRALWVRVGVVVAEMTVVLVQMFRAATDPDVLNSVPTTSASGWALSPFVAYMLLQFLINVIYFSGACWFGERGWNAALDRARLAEMARVISAQNRQAESQAIRLERVRIARELHDAVAHRISLIGVQAGAARFALDVDPSRSTAALEAVEDSARAAIDDLHSLLHTLRDNDSLPPAATALTGPLALSAGTDGAARLDTPGPTDALASLGVERIGDLIDESAQWGLSATMTVVGDPRSLPALISLNLYRIVQEALTNVRRHAGVGTTVDVRVRYSRDSIEVEVSNGRPARRHLPNATGGGLGLIGMRERVESDGGELEAHPLSRGGFVVRARIPLSPREDAR